MWRELSYENKTWIKDVFYRSPLKHSKRIFWRNDENVVIVIPFVGPVRSSLQKAPHTWY